jgi:hypothetical protein
VRENMVENELAQNLTQQAIENITLYGAPYSAYTHVWTYADILSSFSGQFIDQLLRISFLFLVLELTCLWFIRGWDEIAWKNFQHGTKQDKKIKIFTTVVYICMIPAMFLPVTIILFEYGVMI